MCHTLGHFEAWAYEVLGSFMAGNSICVRLSQNLVDHEAERLIGQCRPPSASYLETSWGEDLKTQVAQESAVGQAEGCRDLVPKREWLR